MYRATNPAIIAPAPCRTKGRLWKGVGGSGSMLSAIGIALLPKCPMCFAAYAGIFGYFGLSISPHLWLLHGLLVGALAVSAVFLVIRIGQRRVRRRLLVGAAAMAALLVGKYVLESTLLVYVGLGGLFCFFFWNRPWKDFSRRNETWQT